MEEKADYKTDHDKNINSISFSSNWNNKLSCKSFSTIRVRNDKRFIIGNDYSIILKNEPIYIAKIVSISHIEISKLTPAMSYLDTGYSPQEQIKMMATMYKNSIPDINKVMWSFIVLVHQMLSEA
jgi:hypothetical protein